MADFQKNHGKNSELLTSINHETEHWDAKQVLQTQEGKTNPETKQLKVSLKIAKVGNVRWEGLDSPREKVRLRTRPTPLKKA